MEAPLGRKRLFFATLVLLVAVATQAQADDAIPISSADDSAIRLAAEVPDWAEGKMQLNVLSGDYLLSSGATLWPGSQVYVYEDALTFPPDLIIEVGQGGVTLKGCSYTEGTRLSVGEDEELVVENAQSGESSH